MPTYGNLNCNFATLRVPLQVVAHEDMHCGTMRNQTAKNILQKYKKNVKRKNNEKVSTIKDRKVNTNVCYKGRKSFVTWQIQCRHYGGPCTPHFGLLKIHFLERHVMTRKPTMMQKGIITFNPTYLTKVAYIGSILKFLNTKSLVA